MYRLCMYIAACFRGGPFTEVLVFTLDRTRAADQPHPHDQHYAGMQFTFHASRRTPHGVSHLVQATSAWLVKT